MVACGFDSRRRCQFQMKTIPSNVKCDCGATKKQHNNGEGQCMVNACTWFHPNIKYIKNVEKQHRKILDMQHEDYFMRRDPIYI